MEHNNNPTTYAEANALLGSRTIRKVGNNTHLQRLGAGLDIIGVVLHSTSVVTFFPDGSFRLDSGGWMTRTTKARMNAFLPEGYSVALRGGEWFVDMPHGYEVPYRDGLVLRTLAWDALPEASE